MPGNVNYNLNMNSDHSKDVSFGLGGWGHSLDDNAGNGRGFWTYIAWRPNNALRIELNPSLNWSDGDLHYVSGANYEGDPRYIYGQLSQRSFDASLRIDYSVSPTLTIQFYGAPFIATGDYSHYKRITDPMAAGYSDRFESMGELDTGGEAYYSIDEDSDGEVDYSFYNPDFKIKDFNSNLVVRWEYSPGSSLYLVWSQSRFNYARGGEFALENDLYDLFDIQPRNVFLLKINRWINL
jgi:hypothetical protein